jgi:divalent metal cation (Fe/Co/Zn/Cd) transporter
MFGRMVVVGRAEALRHALRLGYVTVGWNVTEGVVAVAAASLAGSRALLGFGLDSAVESVSAGVVIWRLRAEQQDPTRVALVERRAVRLIGVAFLGLAAVVGVEAVRSLLAGDRPDASPVGIVLTALSLLVMPALARRKGAAGRALGSRAVEADSRQTWACASLSAVVLAGLVLNLLVGWWWADPIAALGVVAFLVREGTEALSAERLDECCG